MAATELLAVANYIAANQQECVDTFFSESGLADDPGVVLPKDELIMEIPDSEAWPHLADVELQLRTIGIGDLAPMDGQGLEACESLEDNDHVVLSAEAPPGTPLYHLDTGVATLTGPGAAPFTGTSLISSQSRARMGLEASGEMVLHNLELGSAGNVVATDGVMTVPVDQFQVQLRSARVMTWQRGAWLLAPGQADFVVSLVSGYDSFILFRATNSAPVRITEGTGTLAINDLNLEYIDDVGQVWSLDVSANSWTEQ